jgi:uncharacterized protein YbjT (DUF2867 family)
MKIAVAGATGRVGRHVVDVLESDGHEVVPISRSNGVDAITGDGLADALAGVEAVVDAATGPSPEEKAATDFFTTAARNLQETGAHTRVQGSSSFPSSAANGSAPATARRRSRTNKRISPARFPYGSCGRPSSTSSLRSSSTGAGRAT